MKIKIIKKQLKKILIPYYVFLTIIVLVMFLFDRENINLMIFLKAILCVETIKGIEHLWFVGYILFCYLITPYLYIIKNIKANTNEIITMYPSSDCDELSYIDLNYLIKFLHHH